MYHSLPLTFHNYFCPGGRQQQGGNNREGGNALDRKEAGSDTLDRREAGSSTLDREELQAGECVWGVVSCD